MASHRLGRITEDIHRELTAIFREVKGPESARGVNQYCTCRRYQ